MSGGVSEGLAYGHSAQGEDSMARLRFAQTRSLITSDQDRAGRNGVRSRDTTSACTGRSAAKRCQSSRATDG